MERSELIPSTHRAERMFLLELLAGNARDFDLDAAAFLAITPQKLLPFVAAQLHGRKAPQTLTDSLRAASRASALRELRRGAELQRIDAALSAAGVRFLVLKGPVLAATVYPSRASRTMTDLDLLVSEEALPRATEALLDAGYEFPLQFAGAVSAAGDIPPLIYREPGGPSIELHTMLESLPDERNAFERMWPGARRVDVGHGLALMTLDRAEFFAHVVTHVSKHHRFENELRSLLDVALLLRSDEAAFDMSESLAIWDRRGISEWLALTLRLAHLLLGSALPAAVAARKVPDEALRIAAEQLWVTEKSPVASRIVETISRVPLSPVHPRVPATRSLLAKEGRGLRALAARQMLYLRRALFAASRPQVVATQVELHRKRERLFTLIEGDRRAE
ncbi:MAG TPA: nucleotidyltransferase family protein [Thermoanaerobaculia bacterium]|jgi:hypothetical protein